MIKGDCHNICFGVSAHCTKAHLRHISLQQLAGGAWCRRCTFLPVFSKQSVMNAEPIFGPVSPFRVVSVGREGPPLTTLDRESQHLIPAFAGSSVPS